MNKHPLNFFKVPEGYDHEPDSLWAEKIRILRELEEFPFMKQVRKSLVKSLEIPEHYLTKNTDSRDSELIHLLRKKGMANNPKNQSFLRIINFYRAAAALFILSLGILYFNYFHSDTISPTDPNNAKALQTSDTCKTLACMEREELLNELSLEMNEEEIGMLN